MGLAAGNRRHDAANESFASPAVLGMLCAPAKVAGSE